MSVRSRRGRQDGLRLTDLGTPPLDRYSPWLAFPLLFEFDFGCQAVHTVAR